VLSSRAGSPTATFHRSYFQTQPLSALVRIHDAIILASVVYDSLRHRRVARAFLWGVPLVIGSQLARELVGATAAWKSFARPIVG
jgi:hypothetical protein